jgi:hypothetical protein
MAKTAKATKTADDSVSLAATVESEMGKVATAFGAGPLFHDSPSGLPLTTRVAAWAVLDALKEMSEHRKDMFREQLLKDAEENGAPTDRGGNRLWVDQSEVIREKRQAKLPDDKSFQALLKSKGIPMSDAFDEVKSYTMNPSKVDFLIQSGRISQEEVDELRKVSWALKVKVSEMIQEFLDSMSNRLVALPKKTKRAE